MFYNFIVILLLLLHVSNTSDVIEEPSSSSERNGNENKEDADKSIKYKNTEAHSARPFSFKKYIDSMLPDEQVRNYNHYAFVLLTPSFHFEIS